MPNLRMTRVNELLRREISTALYRVMTDTNFDMSALTVTRVTTTNDLRNAQVSVSIRADEDAAKQMVSALKRKRRDIQKMVSDAIVLKYTPILSFAIDNSLRDGDHVLDIIDHLNINESDEAEEEMEEDGPTGK